LHVDEVQIDGAGTEAVITGNMENPGKGLIVLEGDEVEALYGRPRFTHEERVQYFALSPKEKSVLDQLPLNHVIVLVLWFDATFVLIARAALQVEDYKLAIRTRTCFSMESIKRRSRWGESALEPLADLTAIGSNIKLSDVVT